LPDQAPSFLVCDFLEQESSQWVLKPFLILRRPPPSLLVPLESFERVVHSSAGSGLYLRFFRRIDVPFLKPFFSVFPFPARIYSASTSIESRPLFSLFSSPFFLISTPLPWMVSPSDSPLRSLYRRDFSSLGELPSRRR